MRLQELARPFERDATGLPLPRNARRRGEGVRVYRRTGEQIASYGGFLCIFVGVSLPLFPAMSDAARHGHTLAVVAGLLVYVVLVGFTIYQLSRVGIEVSSRGVRSVSLSRVVSASWSEIDAFEVVRYTGQSSCIAAKCRDGSIRYLNGLARWTVGEASLEPYCKALNAELARVREVSV